LATSKGLILFIIPNLSIGGIQTQVMLLAKHYTALGHRTKVIGLHSCDADFRNDLISQGIDVEFCPEIGTGMKLYQSQSTYHRIMFWWGLTVWLRKQKPEILFPFTTSIDDFINAVWRLSGARMSLSFERGGHLRQKKEKRSWVKLLKKWSKPVYVSNSQHGAKSLAISRSIHIKKVRVIPNGYSPEVNDKQNHDQNPKLDSSKVVFLMVANFFGQKDHQFLLRAWEIAKPKRSQLIIAGLGKGSVCATNFALAGEFIKEHHLEDQITLLGEVSDSGYLLKLADVGVLTSKTEGCPNVVLEYMGAELPVIARDIPGVREILSHENQQILADFDDPSDLADKILIIESNEGLRKKIGQINRHHVIENFGLKKMFEAYDALLFNKI